MYFEFDETNFIQPKENTLFESNLINQGFLSCIFLGENKFCLTNRTLGWQIEWKFYTLVEKEFVINIISKQSIYKFLNIIVITFLYKYYYYNTRVLNLIINMKVILMLPWNNTESTLLQIYTVDEQFHGHDN